MNEDSDALKEITALVANLNMRDREELTNRLLHAASLQNGVVIKVTYPTP